MKKLLILISLLFFSCGSIEKFKSHTDKEKETEKETASGSETKTTSFKDLFSFEPYDNTKPMIIGRDTIINTRIIKNTETIYTQTKDTTLVKEKEKESVSEDIKHKETDNTMIILGCFGLFLLFMFIVVMLMFKNISSKIPNVNKIL